MALNKQDLRQIGDLIRKQAAETTEELQPKNPVKWLQKHCAIAAVWAVPLGLLGLVLTAGYFAITESSKNSTFRGEVATKVGRLEQDVRDIRLSLAAQRPRDRASQEFVKGAAAAQ